MEYLDPGSACSYLRSHIADKMKNYPSLSLRAIARDLGISQSYLSEILNGKKTLSYEKARQIIKKLNLDRKEQEHFLLLVQLERIKSPEARVDFINDFLANKKIKAFDLTVDQFKSIAEWHHFAIRCLLDMKDFEFTPSNIAKKLDLNIMVVKAAIERMVNLGLLDQDENGNITQAQEEIVFKSDVPNSALRKFHQSMLEKAMESITTQTPQEKFIGSETMAFSQENLKEASEIIEACFKRIKELAEKSPKKDDVYHIGIQLFKLSRSKK